MFLRSPARLPAPAAHTTAFLVLLGTMLSTKIVAFRTATAPCHYSRRGMRPTSMPSICHTRQCLLRSSRLPSSCLKSSVCEDGLIFVGKEGIGAYYNSLSKSSFLEERSVVEVEAGDAVAFYNYNGAGDGMAGGRDWMSLHASLMVPEEKFISTCWFRSEALTGPFGWLHRQALQQHPREN